jgi:hypothetical protein
MFRRLFFALSLMLALYGCTPEVGDACTASVECGVGQVCDTTAEAGYCTLYDCTSSSECPSDSVCADFGGLSACMKPCSSNDDCRSDEGYVCRADLAGPKFCFEPATAP